MDITKRDFVAGAAGLAAALAETAAGKTGPAGDSISRPLEAWLWDLPNEYPSEAHWTNAIDLARSGVGEMASLKGKAAAGPQGLLAVLERVREIRGKTGHLARFAVLSRLIDQSSDTARARYDAATALEAEVEGAVSWLEPEILAIGRHSIAEWLTSEPKLAAFRVRIDRILWQGIHSPPDAERSLLAKMERWPRTSPDIYGALSDVDISWSSVAGPDGKAIVADGEAYALYRRSPNTKLRSAVSRAYLTRLKAMEATYGLLYTRRIEGHLTIAREHGYTDLIDAALDRFDAMPAGTAEGLIRATRSQSAMFARWSMLLGRALATNGPTTFGDLPVLPVEYTASLPIERAVVLAAGALAPFGTRYRQRLAERWAKPWFHLPPTPHKAGDVGVYWQVGGGNPYAIMTYGGDLASSALFSSVSALMMWYADIPDSLAPDRREEDPPVHGNAIWYMGRMLHNDHLLAQTRDPKQRKAILLEDLWLLQRGCFLNIVTTELQKLVNVSVAGGSPMTGAQISAAWLRLLREFYNGVEVEDYFATQWMTQAQGFYNETLTVFALAMSAAAALAESVQNRKPGTLAGLQLNDVEGSRFSHPLLKAAGVDLSAADAHDALFRRLAKRLDQLAEVVEA